MHDASWSGANNPPSYVLPLSPGKIREFKRLLLHEDQSRRWNQGRKLLACPDSLVIVAECGGSRQLS